MYESYVVSGEVAHTRNTNDTIHGTMGLLFGANIAHHAVFDESCDLNVL